MATIIKINITVISIAPLTEITTESPSAAENIATEDTSK